MLAEAESEWWKDQTDAAPPEAADMTKDVFADSDDEGQGPALERTAALVVDMPKQKPVRAKVVNRWLSNPGLDSLLGDDDDDNDGFAVDETWRTNRSLSMLFATFFNYTGTGSRLFALLSHVWLI